MSDRKITAVKQPNKQLGIEIAKMALNQIQNPAAASSEIVRCKCEFLIKESVAALPREDIPFCS